MINQNLYFTLKDFFEKREWYNSSYHYFLMGISSTGEYYINFKINAFCKSNKIEKANLENLEKYKNYILELICPIISKWKDEIDHLVLEGSTNHVNGKWYLCPEVKLKKKGLKSISKYQDWVLYSQQITNF